ncbi:MAG TPA: formimidoylglutamate deiminase [Gemmatimonadota bacterium]|nr:formimidoylglutamate deiminase [Gemmatimonadota bacterium]
MREGRLTPAAVLEADVTWTGSRFESGIRIAVDETGRIEEVGALDATPTQRLPRRALLPGLVDAHSHAFQIGLRGRTERFASGTGSFWTWRDVMYELVVALDRGEFRDLCLRAFDEMRDGGITTVGEFHYLHHATEERDASFDAIVLEAAAEVGIRLVLLQSYYETGGIGRPLGSAQRRFAVGSVAEYWDRFDRLAERIDPATQSLGVAPHSIRAASLDDLAALHAEARRRALPFHMHVEEQRGEIEECVAAYGEPPMALLSRSLASLEGVTAVHCTHTSPEHLAAFVEAGGSVCVCPLTEANLGDGIPDLAGAGGFPDRLCLGTDSNLRIAMNEEMRWLEYGQRLRREERGVLVDADGLVGRSLLNAATRGGAAALGVPAGVIAPGCWADLTALDLDAPELRGCDEGELLDAWVFGAGRAIAATCVGGRWRETGGNAIAGR